VLPGRRRDEGGTQHVRAGWCGDSHSRVTSAAAGRVPEAGDSLYTAGRSVHVPSSLPPFPFAPCSPRRRHESGHARDRIDLAHTANGDQRGPDCVRRFPVSVRETDRARLSDRGSRSQ
jgi:hypothetical protein